LNLRVSEDTRAVSQKKNWNETSHIDETASQTVTNEILHINEVISQRMNVCWGDIFRKDSFWRKSDEEALQERSLQETFMVTSAWGEMVAKKMLGISLSTTKLREMTDQEIIP